MNFFHLFEIFFQLVSDEDVEKVDLKKKRSAKSKDLELAAYLKVVKKPLGAFYVSPGA